MKRLLLLISLILISINTLQSTSLEISKLSSYYYGTEAFAEGAAEIISFNPDSDQLYVCNGYGKSLDIFDISNPENITLTTSFDITTYGGGLNSCAYGNGVVAIAVEAEVKQDNGSIVFITPDGVFLNSVEVGALPDNVVYASYEKDGETIHKFVTACEGEPNDEYTVDPEGSIHIIEFDNDGTIIDSQAILFTDISLESLESSVRVFGPNATPAMDFEPEYITIEKNGTKGFATLQENNAIAVFDIDTNQLLSIEGLGLKDYSLEGNEADMSNKDDVINITNWPVKGFFLPDALTSYQDLEGDIYIITANEGDSRDYDGFSEEKRVKDITLDPDQFPNFEQLQQNENLGRLKITTTMGDIDNDGDFDQLYCYGGRSFTIWNSNIEQIFDSGSQFETKLAELNPDNFNSDDEENDSFDDRSDDKGPEPEGVTVANIDGEIYGFIGLERMGGFMVYNISNPENPYYVDYINNRDFSVSNPVSEEVGDLSPEGLLFIPSEDIDQEYNIFITANEVSGTITLFKVISEGTSHIEDNQIESTDIINCYPNPFNSTTTIRLNIERSTNLNLGLYNSKGELIETLHNGELNKGSHSLPVDCKNLSSGLYFLKGSFENGTTEIRKLNYIR